MNRKLRTCTLMAVAALLLAACTAAPTALPTATIAPTEAPTSTPIIIVVTATAEPATATLEPTSTETPTVTNTPLPKITYTPKVPGAYDAKGNVIKSDKSIVITGIQDKGDGNAVINWTAEGTFSSGFRIYYSYYIKMPSFNSERLEYAIPDGTTRSAYITGIEGTTYYYRICSFTGSSCEFYSNLYTFTFTSATSTP